MNLKQSGWTLALLAIGLAGSHVALGATDGTWTSTADGDWTDATNWKDDVIPSGADATADFSIVDLNDKTVKENVGSGVTVGSLKLGDAGAGLTIAGPNLFSPITMTVTAGQPVINVVSGSVKISATIATKQGVSKTGGGALIYAPSASGFANFDGPLNITAGTWKVLSLGDSLPAKDRTTVSPGATLDINNWTGTTGSLAGEGGVALSDGNLIVGGDNTSSTFSGGVSGSARGFLVKNGTGALTLSKNTTYGGGTYVGGGQLVLGGTHTSAVFVGETADSSGKVSQTGRGALKIDGGGATILNASEFFKGSILMIDIRGTAKGAATNDYDHAAFTNGAKLDAGSTLRVTLTGYTPAAGDSFTIIQGTLTGTFTTVDLPTLGRGLAWDTSKLYTNGVLGVSAAP